MTDTITFRRHDNITTTVLLGEVSKKLYKNRKKINSLKTDTQNFLEEYL